MGVVKTLSQWYSKDVNLIEDSVFFEIRHRAVSELRWKQVKIRHGPATVMKELCLECHCGGCLAV